MTELIDQLEIFKQLFYHCDDLIKEHYRNKEDDSRDILGHIINNKLRELEHDIQTLCFMDFYKKYLKNTLFLDCDDFTISETLHIIEESKLNERDKKLAKYYWVDQKTEDSISEELTIDRKTVRSNIPKISIALKETCAKIYK